MTDVMIKTEDIYETIVRLIEENQIDEAIGKIIEIEDKIDEISLLSRLAHEIVRIRARHYDLTYDRALARVLDLALDLALAARTLARELDLALTYARELDLALTYARELDHARKFNSVILGVLERDTLRTPFREQSITLQGIGVLTPHSLSTQLTPYLQALFDLQAIIDRLNGKQPNTPRITSISQNSPIEISFDGISDAIETVSEIVIPSRRQNAKKRDELQIREKELQIAQGQTELKAREAEIRQEKKLSEVEIEQKKLKAERTRIENEKEQLAVEKMRLEIHQQKINLALTVLNQLSPNLQETERITYIIQLIQPLGVLMESPLEISPK